MEKQTIELNKNLHKKKTKQDMPSTLHSLVIMNFCTLFVFYNKVKPIS